MVGRGRHRKTRCRYLEAGAGFVRTKPSSAPSCRRANRQSNCWRRAWRSTKTNNDLHLTREGGHTCRRIAHVADYTGEAVMQSLIAQIRRRPNIRVYERQMGVGRSNRIRRSVRTDRPRLPNARNLPHPRPPYRISQAAAWDRFTPPPPRHPNVSGDAIAMAIRAGCSVENLEFIQFHPLQVWQGRLKTAAPS